MPSIEILDSGRVDERDSAFPQAVQLPDGDVLCSFSVGGGAHVTGGTDRVRSTDGGKTWRQDGTILPLDEKTGIANFLKLTLSPDGKTVYAYGATLSAKTDQKFGHRESAAVFCVSNDNGQSWSAPRPIPMPGDCRLEISHGLLATSRGRLLAPAGLLPAEDRLGEQVVVSLSDDGGKSWPRHSVVFEDPQKLHGYFEQKLAELEPGRLMATAWTVTLGGYADRPNSFAISNDDGAIWSSPRSTEIMGQTLTPIPLGGDRLLVLYNRRYGRQGIVMLLVTFTDEAWSVHHEGLLYDAKAQRQRPTESASGIDELEGFEFGFPTAIRLSDGTHLTTHWCVENGHCGIRWTRLRVDW